MRFTKRNDIFCREYVKLDDASAAYRIAYSTSNMKSTTVNEMASRLLKKSNVATRVKELKAIAAKIADEEFGIDSRELLGHLNILRKSIFQKSLTVRKFYHLQT